MNLKIVLLNTNDEPIFIRDIIVEKTEKGYVDILTNEYCTPLLDTYNEYRNKGFTEPLSGKIGFIEEING